MSNTQKNSNGEIRIVNVNESLKETLTNIAKNKGYPHLNMFIRSELIRIEKETPDEFKNPPKYF